MKTIAATLAAALVLATVSSVSATPIDTDAHLVASGLKLSPAGLDTSK